MKPFCYGGCPHESEFNPTYKIQLVRIKNEPFYFCKEAREFLQQGGYELHEN